MPNGDERALDFGRLDRSAAPKLPVRSRWLSLRASSSRARGFSWDLTSSREVPETLARVLDMVSRRRSLESGAAGEATRAPSDDESDVDILLMAEPDVVGRVIAGAVCVREW